MSSKRIGPGRSSRYEVVMVAWLGVLSGCSSDTPADATSSVDGGAGNATDGGGANGGGANGGGANGGGANGGATNGGAVGTGGKVGAGGSAGAGGMGQGANAGSTSGGTSGTGGTNGTGGAGGSTPGSTCTNPTHVLPMNPSNPHDGITLGGFYVDTATWNAANYQVSQTMYICDYDNWYAVANMNNDTHDGAVKTYPNVHKDFNAAPQISSFTTISSRFAHTAPHVGIYDFAYDIWLNGVASSGSTEIMIWTDNYNQVPSGSSVDTVTYDGETYDVHRAGSYIAFVDTRNVTSGTVNLLSFFNYVISKGWIPSTSTLGAIDYGVEIVSTGGADATFEVNAFSLTTN